MSPRPGPARKLTAVRLSEAAIQRIRERAAVSGRSVSEEHRAMLAYADRKMPAGWKP